VNPVMAMHTPVHRGPMAPRGGGQPKATTRHRRRDELGAAGVEFLIMAVTLFLLFTTLVQYGIRFHAQRVAEAAAREGAMATARWDGSTAAGRSRAQGYIDDGKPAVLGGQISASRSPTQASATVTVQVPSLMPWLDEPVTSRATAPVERFAQ
jgi:Flp pilus assembly protein TadG